MQLPEGALLREISPWYNELTIPRSLLVPNTSPDGMWAKVVVESGRLEIAIGEGASEPVVADQPVNISPGTSFQVISPATPVRFHIHYFTTPQHGDAEGLAAMLSRG